MCSSRQRSPNEISTAIAPEPAISTWAIEPQRSRYIASWTIAAAWGVFAASVPASAPAPRKPRKPVVAAATLRPLRGTKTATISSSPDAPVNASDGESANQSTCGWPITCRSRSMRTASSRRCPTAAGGSARDQVRPCRQPDQAEHERHDDRELTEAQVERRVGHRRAGVLVEHARDHPQHVHRGEHDCERADHRPAPALLEDAGQDQELAGERRRERHGEGDHADGHEQRRECRAAACHTAEPGELARRRAPLDHPREQEERGGEEPVVDDLQHGAVEAEAVVREQAERDQSGLRERRVGHDPTHVGRAEGQQRPVDERDRGQREQDVPPVVRRHGEMRDRDEQQPVQTRLPDHAGESRGHLGRRLAICVWQPAVEREERRLDHEGDRRSRGTAIRSGSCRSPSGRTCPAGARSTMIEVSISSEPTIV